MAGNANLGAAKAAKNDEFYTQWHDIEKEMRAYLEYDPDVFRDKVVLLPCDDPGASNFTKFFALNFETFGLKKLISTSYAPASNPTAVQQGRSLLNFELGEDKDERFNEDDTWNKGRVYVLERGVDVNADGVLNKDDLKWKYLDGDGDFRSEEVTALRDEADMVITNPPFSLFREFVAWLIEGDVQFSVIGNLNAVTYKEIFPLIRDNKLWLGARPRKQGFYFALPQATSESLLQAGRLSSMYKVEDGSVLANVSAIWFTNIQHGRRHEPLGLMTMEENLIYGSKCVRETAYPKYDNYDAIEVPETKGIPSDYSGIMGVPISFLDKYCPEQFEVLGSRRWGKSQELLDVYTGNVHPPENDKKTLIDGKETYDRIFIRHRNPNTKES